MTVDPFDRRILEEGDTASSNPAADHADQLQRVPIIQGRIVEGSWATGEQTALINHGLDRRFVGAFVIGQSSSAFSVCVLGPGVAVESGDSAINFAAVLDAPASKGRAAAFWVF